MGGQGLIGLLVIGNWLIGNWAERSPALFPKSETVPLTFNKNCISAIYKVVSQHFIF